VVLGREGGAKAIEDALLGGGGHGPIVGGAASDAPDRPSEHALDDICRAWHSVLAFEIEVTDRFAEWYGGLDDKDLAEVNEAVEALEDRGPGLGRPLVDSIKDARTRSLKELRIGTIRMLFAFDHRRVAILLVGSDKSGRWDDWYAEMVPIADDRFEEHLGSR
jgi:hypothetical protein